MIKLPEKKTLKEIKKYFLQNNLKILIKNSSEEINIKDKRFSKKTYGADLVDLFRIHRMIILNKRLSVLEYGTGWSSLVILHALMLNKKKYLKEVKNLRIKKKFGLTIVDNEKKFLKISENRIKSYFNYQINNATFCYSENKMTTFQGRICSYFSKHPRINPDFIYLDGPDQFKIKGRVNNLSIADYEMMPMNADVLSFENFLTPGTIILFDGRTANARFLRSNFQRNWKYLEDSKNDQHVLFLDERPLGDSNKNQLNFYKS